MPGPITVLGVKRRGYCYLVDSGGGLTLAGVQLNTTEPCASSTNTTSEEMFTLNGTNRGFGQTPFTFSSFGIDPYGLFPKWKCEIVSYIWETFQKPAGVMNTFVKGSLSDSHSVTYTNRNSCRSARWLTCILFYFLQETIS